MVFHVNERGEAGRCSAKPGNCPFGGVEDHFTSLRDASLAYERSMSESTFSSKKKITLSSNLGSAQVLDGDLSNSQARILLSSGLCGALALAIHRESGATPYFLVNEDISPEKFAERFANDPNYILAASSHVLVESPTTPGYFVDSYGQQDEESLQDFWEPVSIVRGTPEMLEHYSKGDDVASLKNFAKAALALDANEESFGYDELDEYSDDFEDEED